MASYTDQDFDRFITLSAALTGFTRSDLLGTGVGGQYYGLVFDIAGADICGELFSAFESIARRNRAGSDGYNDAIGARILQNPKIGPVARNIIKMWYLGNWDQMPFPWREQYGAHPRDVDQVVSAHAYTEGLVWRAIGSHPPGAKQPGFGTWSMEPQVEPVLARAQRGTK